MYKVVLHRVISGENLVVGKYDDPMKAESVKVDLEDRVSGCEWLDLVVYVVREGDN